MDSSDIGRAANFPLYKALVSIPDYDYYLMIENNALFRCDAARFSQSAKFENVEFLAYKLQKPLKISQKSYEFSQIIQTAYFRVLFLPAKVLLNIYSRKESESYPNINIPKMPNGFFAKALWER